MAALMASTYKAYLGVGLGPLSVGPVPFFFWIKIGRSCYLWNLLVKNGMNSLMH